MRRDTGSGPDRPEQDPPAPSGESPAAGPARPADGGYRTSQETGEVRDVPVIAGNVRWERPTARSFWNALADPEREALAASGVEEVFRPGSVLCRAGDDTSQVMIIDSGWVKVSVRETAGAAEKIIAVRGQGMWSANAPR